MRREVFLIILVLCGGCQSSLKVGEEASNVSSSTGSPPTPSPSPLLTPTPTFAPTPTSTPIPNPSPTPKPTVNPTPTQTSTPTPTPMQSYSTNFSATENPISEGGHWVGGSTAGSNLWGNVQTVVGFAFGVSEPTTYGDPTAILTGNWGPNQMAQAKVKINSTPQNSCCHEAEVRLRMTISAHTITGYEVYCSVMPNNKYCHIASWGGPNGSWVNLDSCSGSGPSLNLVDGDTLQGTISGTNPVTITAYLNGNKIMQVQDTGSCVFSDGKKYGPWSSGNPGMGFYDSTDNNWNFFGFSSFSAQSQ